jgi:hypothetical protein
MNERPNCGAVASIAGCIGSPHHNFREPALNFRLESKVAQMWEASMNIIVRRPVRFVIVLFSCALLLAASVGLLTTLPRWPTVTWTSAVPPNGTPGSAQPGTIGLARPHAPLPAGNGGAR